MNRARPIAAFAAFLTAFVLAAMSNPAAPAALGPPSPPSQAARASSPLRVPPAPLFRDPIYDGAADPSFVWNDRERAWWVLYTNRRANAPDAQDGVRWCHGTDIGIASSPDGRTWTYRGTAQGLEFEPGRNTFWAPCLVTHGGAYHMFAAYVRGVPADWSGDRHIVHYTSRDLVHWTFKSVLALSSDRVIDAFVYAKPTGGWRMWYKDEANRSQIYAADSEDLDRWTVKGPVVTKEGGQEGPAVFFWRGAYWLLVDRWQGMGVLRSEDLEHWTEQPGTILGVPGTRPDDADIGRHGEVIVQGPEAYLFYFTHPAGPKDHVQPGKHRSSLQVARLEIVDGKLACDRNKPFDLALGPPSGYKPAVPPASAVALRSSDPKLAAAFAWAKAQALDYAFPAAVYGDPVGDWYEAALPSRFAFCMRDVSHQATGAQVLGLGAFNLNMLRKFAAGLSETRKFCSYWEIDKWNRPAPVDYKSDADFWYNLPANFDVLDACARQYVWTGNAAYLDEPAFRTFYEQSVTSYIRAWDSDGDGVPDHRRSDGNRGLGSYNEERHADQTAIGGDLLAVEARAFRSYAALLRLRGEAGKAAGLEAKADALRDLYYRKWRDAKTGRFADLMLEGGELVYDDLFWSGVFPLYYGFLVPGPDREALVARLAGRDAGGIEVESYLPEVFYRFGRDEAAYGEILKLSDPGKKRREYPEVPFALVGAVATGTMGIASDAAARLVATRSRLTAATAWAELASVPVLGNTVTVRHDGRTRSALTNVSGPALTWRATFDGTWPALFVDGREVAATPGTDEAGRPLSRVTVTVPPGKTVSVAALQPAKGDPAPPGPAGIESGAPRAARALARRLLPRQADRFEFEVLPPSDGQDAFELESRGGRIVIRGNTGVSLATGLNWYLDHYCRCQVSLGAPPPNLPDPLPEVKPKVRQESWARQRYFLNYCCFGYSLPWWDWGQWEKLIDWMALHGVNMPLAVTGQEAVWQAVCRQLGLSDAEIAAFLAGPPYLPFQWMGCLDGWGGPLSQSWIDRHAELQREILARERELGMTPVLQGFTGHVPAAIARKFPAAKLFHIDWAEWRTSLLDPRDPLFSRVARLMIQEQTRRFGTDHLYAADTFIEMTPPSGDLEDLKRLSRAIYGGLVDNDPRAVWVLQGWTFMFKREFWTQPRIEAFLGAVPDERMVVLDLFCESRPMWSETRAFCGKPWLWCNIQNFGNNVFLGGALTKIAADLPAARRDAGRGRLAGLGFVNEGLGYNPVVQDLMFEMAWRDEPIDLGAWIGDYARRRYGRANADADQAWRRLLASVYRAPAGDHAIFDQAPTLAAGAGGGSYSQTDLVEAWRDLHRAAGELKDSDAFRFDLVNVARQVLSSHATLLHAEALKAWRAKDVPALEATSSRFLRLLGELDELLATRPEFLLGRWLEDAKRWGAGETERARLEWNARRVLTLWGEGPEIDDYACKQWSGMIEGYYRPRWDRFFRELAQCLRQNKPFDEKAFRAALRPWMAAWSDGREKYPDEPRGDSVAVAGRLWRKYEGAFRPDAVSLTTGKPTSCSSALPGHPADLADDGWSLWTDTYWATDAAKDPDPWWQVDLEKPATVGRVVVVCYFGDQRFYGFTVETSLDGKTWEMAADRRDNRESATPEGYACRFPPRSVRYIRIRQTFNSANTGRHLVEVMAFKAP